MPSTISRMGRGFAAREGDPKMQEKEGRVDRPEAVEDDEELAGRDVSGSGTTDALVGGPGAVAGQSGYTTSQGTLGSTDMGGDSPPGGGTAVEGGTTSEPALDEDASTNI
jgi:hypothetical protein